MSPCGRNRPLFRRLLPAAPSDAPPARHVTARLRRKSGAGPKSTEIPRVLRLVILLGRRAGLGPVVRGFLLAAARLRLAAPEVLLERRREPLRPAFALVRLALRHGTQS